MFQRLRTIFVKPSAADIAERELHEYQRQLLASQAHAAYHAKMAEYYQEGIVRLAQFKPVNQIV